MRRPDLLIIGDSHTAALHEAALARGMDARLLYIGGNFWHESRMRFSRETGLSAAYRPALQRRVRALVDEIGLPLFTRQIPVIASFGYHLGRLVPQFGRGGHSADAADCDARPEALFVSRAMMQAYVYHHRGTLLRLMRQAARSCDLVAVAPPMIQTDPTAMVVAGFITDTLTAQGVRVFDPRREPDWAGAPLPEELRSPDNVHGNAAYGEAVLARLFDRQMIGKAA